jgi:hypothetical protein
MVKFQFDGNVDYFHLDPVAYAPALGEKGMARYRAKLDEFRASLGPEPTGDQRCHRRTPTRGSRSGGTAARDTVAPGREDPAGFIAGSCPSGRTREEGTAAFVEAMQAMTHWNTTAYSTVPTGRGFDVQVDEFDWQDDGGICYKRDGVTIRHWRRIHNMCGATGYRLDWNGLSFVWTGDGRPDQLTIEQCQGVDLFVTELQPDTGALMALKAGIPEVI